MDFRVGLSKDRCISLKQCPNCHGYSTIWKSSFRPASTGGCIHVYDERNYVNIKQRMAPQFVGDRVGGTCGECGDVDRCNEDFRKWRTCWYPRGSIMVREEQDAE